MKETKTVFVRLVEKPERRVIIKRGTTASDYWKYCEEVGCEVWDILGGLPSIGPEPICLWLPKKYIAPGTSEYVQGTEVALDSVGELPEGFDIITLPACKYLLFQGEPFEEADFEEAILSLRAAIEKYDPQGMGLAWDGENPRIALEPIGKRGYIELLPVK